MNDQSSDIRQLFLKYSGSEASETEVREFLRLLETGAYDQEILTAMQEQMMISEAGPDFDLSRWEKVLSKIKQSIFFPSTRMHLWPRIAAAASLIVLAGFGGYFLLNRHMTKWKDQQAYATDIAPGTVGATLVLSSGQQIKIADAGNGEIAKEAGARVVKTADGQIIYQLGTEAADPGKINTLTTGKGQTYMLILPDKSRVWMNAASSLSYEAAPAKTGERRVKLDGEAYFEISKNKSRPFIVETSRQRIRVLGTHFNVNNYADEPAASITLLEGSVSVGPSLEGRASGSAVILKPGQEAINQQGDLKIVKANIEQVMDWQQGDFYLNHVNFKTAMRKIARWYNVEVVYDASVSDAIESGGWISRNKKLSEVLQSIEASGQVRFKVEGRKVTVFK